MRKPDWDVRLAETVNAAIAEPFVWGTHDCGAFALGKCVEAITGVNLFALYATYSDEAGGLAMMDAHGAADVEAFAALLLPRWTDDAGENAPQCARRGDVGVVKIHGRKILVVVMGATCSAPGITCLNNIRRSKMIAAFKVD